ncbi:MAG: hypothetical protein COB59_00390, partial [Rhodospirillaceae bacterium]
STVTAGQWYHIAGTYNGSEVALYIDGAKQGTTGATTGTIGSPANIGSIIGAEASGSGTSNYFTGSIDEVRVWNTTRTVTEIQDNMARQLNGDETGLAGYWNFNEGVGAQVIDQSAASNTGTVNNGATYQNLEHIQVAGGSTYKGMILGADADGDALSYSLHTAPTNGTFVLDASSNTYTYANDGDLGADTFVVTITDANNNTTNETITFDVV